MNGAAYVRIIMSGVVCNMTYICQFGVNIRHKNRRIDLQNSIIMDIFEKQVSYDYINANAVPVEVTALHNMWT